MTTLLSSLRSLLQSNADPEVRKSSGRFFKKGEEAMLYGVPTKLAIQIAKDFSKEVKLMPKREIFEICDQLWRSGYFEEAVIACKLAESLEKQYEPEDFKIFEHWVNNYLTNWADCDTLCNHTIGNFIMMYPDYIGELKRWATSENRWTKRASAVTLIIPARRGLFLKEVFEIADILLLDKDDLVQKGYGWMLKATSESNLDNRNKVFEYVISKRAVMPRTALRYAIEKMPKEMKMEAMKKG